MEQYIPKAAVVAEIERLVNNYDKALDYEAALEDVRDFLDTLEVKEEPVSEDLMDATNNYCVNVRKGYPRVMDETDRYICNAFKAGAKWQKENLWKPADGEDLPEYEREVIVLTQPYPLEGSEFAVSFAHRPNKYAKVWNSDLGEEQVVEIERHDKGGWNIPDVKYWLDVDLPKLEED